MQFSPWVKKMTERIPDLPNEAKDELPDGSENISKAKGSVALWAFRLVLSFCIIFFSGSVTLLIYIKVKDERLEVKQQVRDSINIQPFRGALINCQEESHAKDSQLFQKDQIIQAQMEQMMKMADKNQDRQLEIWKLKLTQQNDFNTIKIQK